MPKLRSKDFSIFCVFIMKRYFSAGIAAARANLIPGLILQGLMVGFLVAYFLWPPARWSLDLLASVKVEVGYLYALVAGAVAGGLLPEVLRVALFQRFSFRRENFVNLVFGMIFWALMGVTVDAFYRLQGGFFGNEATFSTVAAKVLLDMLAFTPFFGVPAATIAYTWRHADFRPGALRPMFTLDFYRVRVLPVLFPNWAVWGPVVCVIYSLPPGLQIPVYAFAQAFWALVLMTLTRHRQDVS